ncbi:MAG TPA: UDP-N-acetylglucosamine 2-epimerase [Actinoplanes sp.]|nr:UDP-N-acetylglucosamine 2-epimerase [Actinoplanes sp.]
MSIPVVELIGGTGTEAVKLAPVARAMRAAGLLLPVMIAAGAQLTTVARALATFDLAPDLALPAEALTDVIRRLDALWTQRRPAAVVVQGHSEIGLAGALAATWRRIPVAHLSAGLRSDEFGAPAAHEANGRLIAQVAAVHLVPVPIAAMNLIDEGVPARSILLTGDTGYDAALVIAHRRLPTSRVAPVNAHSDGRAGQRAAQAVAALLGLAPPPAPMPVPAVAGTTSTATHGA